MEPTYDGSGIPLEPERKTDSQGLRDFFAFSWASPLIQHLISNRKILFIKEVRALTGLGLKEAKDIADETFAKFTFPELADSWAVQNAEHVARERDDLDRQLHCSRSEVDRLHDELVEAQRDLGYAKDDLEAVREDRDRLESLVHAYRKVLKDVVD